MEVDNCMGGKQPAGSFSGGFPQILPEVGFKLKAIVHPGSTYLEAHALQSSNVLGYNLDAQQNMVCVIKFNTFKKRKWDRTRPNLYLKLK